MQVRRRSQDHQSVVFDEHKDITTSTQPLPDRRRRTLQPSPSAYDASEILLDAHTIASHISVRPPVQPALQQPESSNRSLTTSLSPNFVPPNNSPGSSQPPTQPSSLAVIETMHPHPVASAASRTSSLLPSERGFNLLPPGKTTECKCSA